MINPFLKIYNNSDLPVYQSKNANISDHLS